MEEKIKVIWGNIVSFLFPPSETDKIFEDFREYIKQKEPLVFEWLDKKGYEIVSVNTRLIGYGYTICKKRNLIEYSIVSLVEQMEKDNSHPSIGDLGYKKQ